MTIKNCRFRSLATQSAIVLATAIFVLATPAAAIDADSMPIRYECSGNEPFWNLHLDGRDATFSRLGAEATESQEIQGHFRLLDYAGVFAWRGPLQGDPPRDAVVFVARQVCLDTMAESGERGGAMDYGIGISLPDGSVLLGCCRGGEPPPEDSEEEP